MSYLIINGLVYLDGTLQAKNISIKAGVITQILAHGELSDNQTIIDATGKIVAPGFIDVHVHLREPGFTHKETIKTGSYAAASGGYTTICAMPNTNPIMDNVATVNQFYQQVEQTSSIHVKTYAAITKGLKSEELVDFSALKAAGSFAFTNDGVGVQSANTMYQAMVQCAKVNMPLVAHCEDNSLIWEGALHHGKISKKLGVKGIPSICESVQIARDVLLAEAANCHYHVCHVSTKESVRVIRDAKKAGIKVTAEVSPHHLILAEDDISTIDTAFKMNPPLRANEDKAALITGLEDGTIDCIATDHAPHHIDEKKQDIYAAPFGIIGLEDAFSLLYSEFVLTEKWTLSQLIAWLTTKPAAIFSMKAGKIELNAPADITILNLNQEKVITNKFNSKASNSPFIGRTVTGIIEKTFVAGKLIYENNKGAKSDV
ncbi:MAG: dihydroorotase [Culicoidibacterales bacterium]